MSQKTGHEILEAVISSAEKKAQYSFLQLILLGFLAGCFIALAGAASAAGSYFFMASPETAGFGRMLSGLIFPGGLIMVFLTGAELFTGNHLMIAAVLQKRITAAAMMRNWVIVYLANLAGSLLVAWAVVFSGLLETGAGMMEQVTLSIAVSKVSLPFGQALIRGVFCNFLVCIAVWMGTCADSTVGKIFALFFPIWIFVTAGFEHSIANMYFIPAGIFAGGGVMEELSWSGFFAGNLLPVTLGNLIGGICMVAVVYYMVYQKDLKQQIYNLKNSA